MKLFKSKSATRNYIYNIVSSLTKGFFTDTAWESVSRVWKALSDEGVMVILNSSEYDRHASPPTFKKWNFTIEVNGFTFDGTMVASFCGTKEDLTGRYDLCFII